LAINIQTFKTRTLTALIFVIVMLAGLFINAWSFIALFLFIMAGCLYEFVKILRKINGNKYFFYLPLALIYIVMPILMMIDLGISGNIFSKDRFISNDFFYSPLLPCSIIFSIWINDTMAYLVGSFIGKTPFSKISPKKTWEGTIGGIFLCVIVIALAGNYIHAAKIIGWQHWLWIAAGCAVFGTAGDLLESKLKRIADIKDSGSFMPGHGGFLDRFDSLLIAIPFVWLYIKLIF
jgi:phosphatidate cytidylyltransferase